MERHPSSRARSTPGLFLALVALLVLVSAPVVALASAAPDGEGAGCCAMKGPRPSCCCPESSSCRTERVPSGSGRTSLPETSVSSSRSKESRPLVATSPARHFAPVDRPEARDVSRVDTGPPVSSPPLERIQILRI